MDNEITMDDGSNGVILVMGVTGAGKSYFINQLKSQSTDEGHSLYSGIQYPFSPSFCYPHPFGISANRHCRDTDMSGCSDYPR